MDEGLEFAGTEVVVGLTVVDMLHLKEDALLFRSESGWKASWRACTAAEFRSAGDVEEISRSRSRPQASGPRKCGRDNDVPPMYRSDVLGPSVSRKMLQQD